MTPTSLLEFARSLAPLLRRIDAALMDAHPGRANPGPPCLGLDDAVTGLHGAVAKLAATLVKLGEDTELTTASSAAHLPDRVATVADAAQALIAAYRRIASRPPQSVDAQQNDRLLQCARDNLVILAQLVGSMIEHTVRLARRSAGSGQGGTAEVRASFDAPENADQLASFRPLHLAYAQAATQRALDALEQDFDLGPTVASEPEPPSRPPPLRLGWLGILGGLLIGNALFNDDCPPDSGCG